MCAFLREKDYSLPVGSLPMRTQSQFVRKAAQAAKLPSYLALFGLEADYR